MSSSNSLDKSTLPSSPIQFDLPTPDLTPEQQEMLDTVRTLGVKVLEGELSEENVTNTLLSDTGERY